MFIIFNIATVFIFPLGKTLVGGLSAILASTAGRRQLAFGVDALFLVRLWGCFSPVSNHTVRGSLEGQNSVVDPMAMSKAGAIILLSVGIGPLGFGASYPNHGSASDREWNVACFYDVGKALLLI